jgi:DNA ligase 1
VVEEVHRGLCQAS